MRVLVMAFLMFQSATSLARVTSDQLEHFTCGWRGGWQTLSLNYDGPRYGDSVFVTLSPETVSNLTLPSDVLKVVTAKLQGFMTMGSCEKNPSTGILIRCTERYQPDHGQNLTLKFERVEKTPEGVEQQIEISRNILINKLDIVVKQVGSNAILELTGQANNGLYTSIPVAITQNLGEIGAGSACRFETQSWYDRIGN